ncbi:unnamed protein product [Triticum turgidum subsp. durum]|uniref:glycerophosphodiester phosphodiesterase n=1 Tax=Triticum turgidum subsp. durum TaxID=4567 RepID=A0A9R0QRY5_TRITD|nr:unnamed protein product [Triticum turgidum subsp. durum]
MVSLWHTSVIVLVLLFLGGSDANPAARRHGQLDVNHKKKPLQTSRPYNIAHRGSNGEIPEETAAAYLRAIEEGADFIETDILASKDGHLICFHDVILDATTDIVNRTEFAGRKRTYDVQGFKLTGWFIVDFTLRELKSLRVKQRYNFRDQQYNWKYNILTFDEFILIALHADRVVGIYPEIKNPIFINQHVKWSGGKKFEDKFVGTLLKHGYKGKYMSKDWLKKPLFIQSFAPTSLIYISNMTNAPKLLLIYDTTVPTQDTNQSYYEITSNGYLAFIRKYVIGIGPWKDTIIPPKNNHLGPATNLVARAHTLNLQCIRTHSEMRTHSCTSTSIKTLMLNMSTGSEKSESTRCSPISRAACTSTRSGQLHTKRRKRSAEDLLHEIAKTLKVDVH